MPRALKPETKGATPRPPVDTDPADIAAHAERKQLERAAALKGVGKKKPAPGNAGQPPRE